MTAPTDAARPGADREALIVAIAGADPDDWRKAGHHIRASLIRAHGDMADRVLALLASQPATHPATPAPVDGDAVERAAQALYALEGGTWWEKEASPVRDRLRGDARMVLAAARADAPSVTGEQVQPTRRLRSCVERWPDAETGAYDPYCCRFPKSCSATVYDPALVSDADLEGGAERG